MCIIKLTRRRSKTNPHFQLVSELPSEPRRIVLNTGGDLEDMMDYTTGDVTGFVVFVNEIDEDSSDSETVASVKSREDEDSDDDTLLDLEDQFRKLYTGWILQEQDNFRGKKQETREVSKREEDEDSSDMFCCW